MDDTSPTGYARFDEMLDDVLQSQDDVRRERWRRACELHLEDLHRVYGVI